MRNNVYAIPTPEAEMDYIIYYGRPAQGSCVTPHQACISTDVLTEYFTPVNGQGAGEEGWYDLKKSVPSHLLH